MWRFIPPRSRTFLTCRGRSQFSRIVDRRSHRFDDYAPGLCAKNDVVTFLLEQKLLIQLNPDLGVLVGKRHSKGGLRTLEPVECPPQKRLSTRRQYQEIQPGSCGDSYCPRA